MFDHGMPIYQLGADAPQIHPTAFVAAGAVLIGRVTLEAHASVWDGAVLRGDNEPIVIGANSNVQEGAVLHTDPGCPLTVGQGVTIGHQAMLHGCTIGDGALIGIQAVLLNKAVIGRECLVGAQALVTEGKVFDDGQLLMGSPAKVVKALSAEQRAGLASGAQTYVARAEYFRTALKLVRP
jgi:carbonic anhydrase/acetyltransferase-like protein (isoleucine patch superfamily)